ncbi:hypothetical protein Tco_0000183 [Tanacetum coccineum]
MTARISIRDEPSISLPPREEIPSPPLPALPPAFVLPALPPANPTHPLGYRAAMIQLSAKTPSTSHPLPLPTSSPPFSAATAARPIRGRRADYRFIDTVDAEISRRRAKEVGYRIRDAWVDPRDATEKVALTTLEGVNTRVTELAAVQEQDT